LSAAGAIWPIRFSPARRALSNSLSDLVKSDRLLDDEPLRVSGEVPVAGLGDDDEVLDADAADARVIEAGLDGDRGVVWEGSVGEPRGLVDLKADAVAEAVEETGAATALFCGGESAVIEELAHRVLDGGAVGVGADLAEGAGLGVEDGLVQP